MAEVTGRIGRLPAAVFLLLAAYFVVNIIVRLSLPHTLELDEAEQLFYSQWRLFGYGPQPPLYNWLQTAMFALTGKSILGLSLLKNLLLFSVYLFYWLAAAAVIRDNRLRIVAVLALLTLPQVSFMAQQDLTHTVVLLSATSLFLYAFYRILVAPDLAFYVLAGIAVGLGFLAKYNFPLLPIAALLAVLPERDLRSRIFNWRLLLAIAIAAVIVLPHAFWLMHNLGAATARTLEKMNEDGHAWNLMSPIQGIASLAVAGIAFSALTMLLFVAVYRRSVWTVLRSRSTPIAITERMLLLLLIALAVVVIASGATHIRERWLDPFLLVLPLYLAMKIEAAGLAERVTRKPLIAIALLIMIAVPASLYLRVATSTMTGDYTKLNVPFDRFAAQVAADGKIAPGLVLAEDRHLAGNMLLNLPDTPVMTTQYPDFVLPWAKDKPILVVWRSKPDGQIPAPLKAWLDNNAGPRDHEAAIRAIDLPYHYARDGEQYRFRYVMIEPVP